MQNLKNIPTEVVEILNEADCIDVNLNDSPKFKCEKCLRKMVPIYYISVYGRTYEYKSK